MSATFLRHTLSFTLRPVLGLSSIPCLLEVDQRLEKNRAIEAHWFETLQASLVRAYVLEAGISRQEMDARNLCEAFRHLGKT